MSSASAAAAPRAAPAAVATPARGSAGARNRRAGTEIMSVMLTYLTPIVSAGKTFYRPACLFVSQGEPRKGLQIGQFLPSMGPPARQVGEAQAGAQRPRRPRGMADTTPYHDRDGSIWYDGKLVPWREAGLHVLSHGLHYASAVFEGERAYNGVIFELSQHSQRLVEGARTLDFEIPFSVAEINQA